MRALIFGDVHIMEKNEYSQTTEDGMTTLLHESMRSLEWVIECINNYKDRLDIVVNTGDLFHRQGTIEGLSLNVGWKASSAIGRICAENKLPFVSLVGNHECIIPGRISTVPFLEHPSIGILCKDAEMYSNIMFIPYTQDYGVVRERIQWYIGACEKIRRYPIIISHLDIIGGEYGPTTSSTGISVSEIGHAIMFNGHHHTPQVMENEYGGKVINIGSLTYQSFKDQYQIGKIRGVMYADIPVKGDNITYRWIENPHTSIFYTIEAKSEIEALDKVMEVLPNNRMNLRVLIDGFTPSDDIVPKEAFKNVKIIDVTAHNVARHSFSEQSDPAAIWRSYLSTLDVEIDETAYDMGIEMLKQASYMATTKSYQDVKILEWGAENFMSIGKVDVTVPSEPSVITILGENKSIDSADSNGAGKSSLFEIIPFTLWGSTLRNLESMDYVVNTVTNKDGCFTYIKFSVGNLVYEVRRARNWGTPASSYVNILCNGELLDIRGIQANNKKILEIIGITFEEFKHLVYLGGKDCHFSNMTDDTRKKNLIHSIIGTDLYTIAERLASDNLKHLTTRVETLENDIFNIKESIHSKQTEIDKLNYAADERKRQAGLLISRWEERIKEEEVTIIDTKKLVEEKKNEYDQNERKLEAIKERVESISETFSERVREADHISSTIADLHEKKSSMADMVDRGVCDRCGQKIPKNKINDAIVSISNEISEHNNRLDRLRNTIGVLHINMQATKDKYDEYMTISNSLNSELNEYRRMIVKSHDAIETFRGEIEEAEKEKSGIDMSKKIGDITQEINRLSDVLNKVETKLSQKLLELEAAKFVYEHFHATKLRSYVLDHALNAGNEYIKKLSGTFSNGDIQVQITPTKDLKKRSVSKFNMVTNMKAPSYRGCSFGERDRMGLMIEFALSELSRKYRGMFNILIIDEEGTGLDDTGMESFIEVLNTLGRVVFLVSHQARLKLSSGRSIKAIKENDITRYDISI